MSYGVGRITLAPQDNVGSLAGDYVELFTGEPATHDAPARSLGPWQYRVYVRGPRD